MNPGTYTLQAPPTVPNMVEVSLAPGTTLKIDAAGVVRNEHDSELFRLEPAGPLLNTMPIPVQAYEDLIDRKTALEDQVLALAEQVVRLAAQIAVAPLTYFTPEAQPTVATAPTAPTAQQWRPDTR